MYAFYGVDLPDQQVEETEDADDPMNLAKDRYVEMMKQPHKEDEVLIEDEFGRLRWVKRGSDDHMNHMGSNYRIRKQVEGKLSSSLQSGKKMSRSV